MCLTISIVDNTYKNGLPIPTVLKKRMVVYKVLQIRKWAQPKHIEDYFTPYTCYPIIFSFSRCKLPKIEDADFSRLDGVWKDEKSDYAYHSFTDKYTAAGHTRGYDNLAVFKAVIPKGSLVFYGTDDEICSNRLIIYKRRVKIED